MPPNAGYVTAKNCFETILVKNLKWRIQKILVGGDLKHKTSKIRMSSPKLRLIFRPKSEIQTFFSPKFRWSPKKKKKKKKKRSSPKLRLIFRPKSEIQTFFSPKFRWSPKQKKKKKKKVFTKIETNFSAEIGNSNVFFAQISGGLQKKKKKKKKKVFTKIETDFSPDWLRLGRWGGCIPKWSRFIRNRG